MSLFSSRRRNDKLICIVIQTGLQSDAQTFFSHSIFMFRLDLGPKIRSTGFGRNRGCDVLAWRSALERSASEGDASLTPFALREVKSTGSDPLREGELAVKQEKLLCMLRDIRKENDPCRTSALDSHRTHLAVFAWSWEILQIVLTRRDT